MTMPEAGNENYRILVVDDNQAIHADLTKILIGELSGQQELADDEELLFGSKSVQLARFEIDSAYQGQEGLAMVERSVAAGQPYALAFVDVRMPPGWDGIETVSRLWQVCPDLQVVICTAYSDYSWNDMIRKLGHSDNMVILKKPFDNIEVIQLAHALTKKWKVSAEARAKRQDLERLVHQATEELSYRAYHDTLTGLPNRRLFTDRLQQAILLAHRHVQQLALFYIDLDGFKNVNDTLGHALGDVLLSKVVERLKDRIRGSDTLARMGGDEFTLIVAGLETVDGAELMAVRLRDALQQPFQVDGKTLFVTASLGISVYPRDGRDETELLRCADAAMYEAKRRGRNRVVVFAPEIGRALNERLEMESALRHAISNGEFRLHFQPLYELGSRRLVRFEALLRWTNPILGVVPPLRFIPVAEESGLIVPIGAWVIEEACRTAKRWAQAGYANVPVAVNISARQFCREDFIDTVLGILDRTSLNAAMLELELTETTVVEDFAAVAPKIAKFRELGIRVSIDDFGSGYSSFSYLQRLPVAAIKVDRCFVEDLESNTTTRSIVLGMVRLAHSIGLRVVIEGVETAGQLKVLEESGADEVQGYLLGRPAPASQHIPQLAMPPAPVDAVPVPAAAG